MASLRYHAGRMVLHRKEGKWHVKIKTKDGKLHFPLEAEELENAVRTLKQLCNRQGSLIKDLKSKADDLGRDAQAIAKITHWYGTRKQLKWWQKLI